MKQTFKVSGGCVLLLAAALALVSCGGGGGGGSAPLQAPTYTVGGTWSVTYGIGSNSCGVSGNLLRTLFVTHTAGSNSLTIRDSRSSESQPATISGSTISFSGPMYPEFDCTDQSGNFSVNLSDSTHFSGSGSVTCNDAPACTAGVTVTGVKQ